MYRPNRYGVYFQIELNVTHRMNGDGNCGVSSKRVVSCLLNFQNDGGAVRDGAGMFF